MKNTEHGLPSRQSDAADKASSVRQATQGRWLIARLKRRAHSYSEMLDYRVSLSPWKRIKECLGANEMIVKRERDGLTTWAVRRVERKV